MDSYVLRLWAQVFRALRYFSPYFWVCQAFPEKIVGTWAFSDSWVLGWTVLATFFVLLVPFQEWSWYSFVGLALGGVRVTEIVGYLFNVLLFKNYGENPPPLRSARRSLLLALHNYLEIVLWFAVAYNILSKHFTGAGAADALAARTGCIYFSVVTMTTLGYGDVIPKDKITWSLVTIQTTLGLFMALIVVAWLVGILPQRKSIG